MPLPSVPQHEFIETKTGKPIRAFRELVDAWRALLRGSPERCFIQWGTGSPETVVVAPVGSVWLRTDGGAGTTLYVKEAGVAAIGWAAK